MRRKIQDAKGSIRESLALTEFGVSFAAICHIQVDNDNVFLFLTHMFFSTFALQERCERNCDGVGEEAAVWLFDPLVFFCLRRQSCDDYGASTMAVTNATAAINFWGKTMMARRQ